MASTPDAGFADVGAKTNLKLKPRSLELNPSDELLFPELRGQLRNIGSAISGIVFTTLHFLRNLQMDPIS